MFTVWICIECLHSLKERVALNKMTVMSDGGVSKRKTNRFLCQKKV